MGKVRKVTKERKPKVIKYLFAVRVFDDAWKKWSEWSLKTGKFYVNEGDALYDLDYYGDNDIEVKKLKWSKTEFEE